MVCRVCGIAINPSPNKVQKSDFICPGCLTEYNRAYRQRRKESGNPVKSGKSSREYQQKYAKTYYQSPEKKKMRAERAKARRLDPEERPKALARWMTNRAIAAGRLIKNPCEICGEIKVDAHHDDYFKPLEVRWLCRQCHRDLHAAKAKGGS